MNTNQGPQIHPIFGTGKFPWNIHYNNAFQEAVILASRILKTQQSYHWLYALWFGKNKRSRVPHAYKNKSSPEAPEEYTTNRGIGELTQDEIEAVDQQLTALSRRIDFKVEPLSQGLLGFNQRHRAKEGQRGCRSTICIAQDLYDLMIEGTDQSPRETALLIFTMAIVLLHELAHAAHGHTMGARCEDFFEDALVAEAGYDYVGRIFGMVPHMFADTTLRSKWVQWQNDSYLNPRGYPLDKYCRNVWRLPTESVSHPFDVAFAERLSDDKWWEAADDRSADLVLDFLLLAENSHLLATTPASFRRWLLLQNETKSGARDTVTQQHDQIINTAARSSLLEIRRPTFHDPTSPPLEADPPTGTDENDMLYHAHLPFPETAEEIRQVIPEHGIGFLDLLRLFMPTREEAVRFNELVMESCWFDDDDDGGGGGGGRTRVFRKGLLRRRYSI